MKRIFGLKKDKAPAPSVQDATDRVDLSPSFSFFLHLVAGKALVFFFFIFLLIVGFSFFLSCFSATKRRVVKFNCLCCLTVHVCVDF